MTARRFIFELAATAGNLVPEWVHLLPDGASVMRDGRKCILSNPDAVIAQFHADSLDLPIDYEHEADRPATRANGPVKAAGWITELGSRADGLWGRVQWTATAAQMIKDKEYRYLSPSFLRNEATTEVVKLRGAGLVHHPALHLTALASQDATMTPSATPATDAKDEGTEADLVTALTTLFGLAPDTPIAQLVTALKAMADKLKAPPNPAQYVPVSTKQEVLAERK